MVCILRQTQINVVWCKTRNSHPNPGIKKNRQNVKDHGGDNFKFEFHVCFFFFGKLVMFFS